MHTYLRNLAIIAINIKSDCVNVFALNYSRFQNMIHMTVKIRIIFQTYNSIFHILCRWTKSLLPMGRGDTQSRVWRTQNLSVHFKDAVSAKNNPVSEVFIRTS